MKFYQKFKFKMTLQMLLLGLVPLLIVFGITTFYVVTNTIEQVYESNTSVVQGFKNSIDGEMRAIESVMTILANNESVMEMNPEAMEGLLMEVVMDYDGISQIYVMNTSGMQIFKTSGELGDRADREYFKKAMEGEGNYSAVIISGSTGKPIIVRAEPILQDGEIVGVIGASVDLTFLSNILTNVDLDEKSYGYIVDIDGVVLAHPDESLISEKVSLLDLEPVQEVINGKDGFSRYTFEGDDRFASYTFLDRTQWGILIQTPSVVAFKDIVDLIYILVPIILVAAVFTILGALVISNKVSKPLVDIEEQIEKAKDGNLNLQMNPKTSTRKDEFGNLANNFMTMIAEIRKLLMDSQKLSIEVNDVSRNLTLMAEETKVLSFEITNAVEEIATGAGDQAEESEKSVMLATNFNKKFASLSESSESMGTSATNVIRINEESKPKLISLEEASNVNIENTRKVESSIKNLNEKSDSIANILETITSISQQTNLLALNASIEAARAGEQGRGFAVVADEIRKLAEGSSDAASEINLIIQSIQDEINNSVELMKMVSRSTKLQNASVLEVHNAFGEIDTSVNVISMNISKVDNYVKELSAENSLIVDAISNISSVSEETAAASEEVTASVSQQLTSVENVADESLRLKSLADELSKKIDQFKI